MSEVTELLSRVLNKPSKYFMVIVEPAADLMFAAESAPAAYAELKSIGLPEEQTAAISSEICGFLEQKLEIQPNRIYIEFSNAERHLVGWNSGTF